MGQRYDHNLDRLDQTVTQMVKDFGLDSPSRRAPTVGNRAANTIADRISERGLRGEGPDGQWPGNAERTIKKKGFDRANYETGQMLQPDQIAGEVTVSHAVADIVQGKDEDVKARGYYAETGQGSTGIIRPFFWITGEDADEVLDGFISDFMDHIQKG